MDARVRTQLLGSIHANRLAVICGAGLSMGPPTNLPSATALASRAAEQYGLITGVQVPDEAKGDLEILARLIWSNNHLRSVFIDKIVEWAQFRHKPNGGHEAIADFVLCGAADVVVSTNYDTHIEDAALHLGERDFLASLDGDDANTIEPRHKPLLKLHGCCAVDRGNTVWLVEQLNEPPVDGRIRSSQAWLRGRLRQRDLLFVGFWSDWGYLNEILESVITGIDPTEQRQVILVDPEDPEKLRSKAPGLWRWAEEHEQVMFTHVRAFGEEFLDDLRRELSRQFLRRLHYASRTNFEAVGGDPAGVDADPFASLDTTTLYALRRDVTGRAPDSHVRTLNPDDLRMVGAAHLLLLSLGASVVGPAFDLNGKTVRVVNGAGKLLSYVRAEFDAAATHSTPVDVVVCVSATDDPMPSNFVRPATHPDLVRTAVSRSWVTERHVIDLFRGGAADGAL